MGEIHDPSIERHYAGLLGVAAPWEVNEVTREPSLQRVTIRVVWPERTRPLCPTCGQAAALHDKRERHWRHLDAMGHEVQLVCAARNAAAPDWGRVRPPPPPVSLQCAQLIGRAAAGRRACRGGCHAGCRSGGNRAS